MHDYFGNYNLRGYLQLGLCVALGNFIHLDLNSYAVLTVFMQTSQFTNVATQRGWNFQAQRINLTANNRVNCNFRKKTSCAWSNISDNTIYAVICS